MKQPNTFWKVLTAFIAIFIGSVLIDSWILEPDRIEFACGQIKIEAPISDVFTKAKEFNLRLIESKPEGDAQQYIILHGGSFSRYVCEITHDGNRVLEIAFIKANVR